MCQIFFVRILVNHKTRLFNYLFFHCRVHNLCLNRKERSFNDEYFKKALLKTYKFNHPIGENFTKHINL